ncbi:putative olfactory receptor 52P1 [Dromiciops gliroides]|uniref:putative olfactory receptor 52P1 n=1 Tax=Dromiciops gliroides TaxID=33562 RepID=UPI001CC679B6|nr:putative olfactory receptor 52P1 [Dromiciops gliroides]
MLISNHSGATTFTLLGIPGLEAQHLWLSIPFSTMFVAILMGNCSILFLIVTEPSLQTPMYFLLALLMVSDLASTLAVLPRLLWLFWFDAHEISTKGCLVQMFFIHCVSVVRSALLVAMAFDRYVAVCEPLRYNTILNYTVAGQLALASLAKGVILILPMLLLLQRLTFCRTIIAHTYCDHMAVVKMACAHTKVNRLYGVFVFIMVLGLDLVLIGISYALILHAVLRLSSRDATLKTLNTCSAHFFVILISYVPALFSFLTHRLGHLIPPHAHILLANLYLLTPSLFNPIIYGIKMKEIRYKMAKCLCRRDTLAINPGHKEGSE